MTTYTGPYLKMVWNGYLAGGQDIWSCGLALAPLQVVTSDVAIGQQLVQAGYDQWTSVVFGDTANYFAASTVLTGTTLYYHANSAANASEEWAADTTTPQPSGTATSALPSECSVCLTTLTGFPGRSKRGRMYLPGLGTSALATSGFVGTEAAADLASAGSAVLSALNATLFAGEQIAECVVRSAVLGSYTTIDSVKVGNVVDSQRRRRNAIIEDYTVEPVTV